MRLFTIALLAVSAIIAFNACDDDDKPCSNCPNNDLISGEYNPQPYNLAAPSFFPPPIIPADNPLTVEGVELGRKLFYDKILSADGTMSCASCHLPEKSFTDGNAVSTGILGIAGRRSSMAVVNLAYNAKGFFWDGRAATLEEQALMPVEDHIELNESWPNVIEKIRNHADYPLRFRKAFGIDRKSEITKELAAKAIAQFERTFISADSKYDKVVWKNEGWFTDQEERGKMLFFFEESQIVNHPGCSHCHIAVFFTDNNYKNNGLDNVASLTDFPDLGRGAINGNVYDNGKFRVPTLRNIELTAPYMHDGRFQTLEEVLNHYSAGGHNVENEDVNIRPFPLTEQDKQDLIAFMKTLTDTSFVNNPAFSDPFK